VDDDGFIMEDEATLPPIIEHSFTEGIDEGER
jgi:hypothetical protein